MKDVNAYLKQLERLEAKESRNTYKRKYERLEVVVNKPKKKGK